MSHLVPKMILWFQIANKFSTKYENILFEYQSRGVDAEEVAAKFDGGILEATLGSM